MLPVARIKEGRASIIPQMGCFILSNFILDKFGNRTMLIMFSLEQGAMATSLQLHSQRPQIHHLNIYHSITWDPFGFISFSNNLLNLM
jgi:hypothetical protein